MPRVATDGVAYVATANSRLEKTILFDRRRLAFSTRKIGEEMNTRTRTLAVALAAVTTLAPWSARPDVDEQTALPQLISEAIARNPSIEAMRNRTRELDELANVSNTWPDPMFMVEYMNAPVDSFELDERPMSGVQFTLQQRLPEWGWTGATRAIAEHDVERSRHARAEAEVQLVRSVETLYWQLALSRHLKAVTQEHLDRTLELLRAVQARYEVGKAGQNALLRVEVLRDRLRDDLEDFERADRSLSAGLARALARQSGSQFETLVSISPVEPAGDPETWLAEAQRHRPELARIQEEIALNDKTAELSRISIRPEVDVFVRYRIRTIDTPLDDGTDFVSAGLSFPIPWGSRKRGLGREAANLAALDGARARLAAALDQIQAELVEIDASWRRAAKKSTTYRETLIPAAEVALETTLSEFAVGKGEFSTLYEAEVDLLVLERSYLTATVETRIQRANARAVTGRRDLGDAS